MKKYIFLLFVFILLLSATPTRVRVADKPEYQKYLAYCNETIPVRTAQYGKVKIQQVNNQFTDSLGNYKLTDPPQIYWYALGASKFVCEPNELLIKKQFAVWKKRRKSSVRDFYEWWIPYGKAGN